jgi:hypothetical protein
LAMAKLCTMLDKQYTCVFRFQYCSQIPVWHFVHVLGPTLIIGGPHFSLLFNSAMCLDRVCVHYNKGNL